MFEVFESKMAVCTITDEGVTVEYKASELIHSFPYGSLDSIQESSRGVGFFGNPSIRCIFVPASEDKQRLKDALVYVRNANNNAPKCLASKRFKNEPDPDKEYRMRCNVCGNVFCYTQKDLDANEAHRRKAVSSSGLAVLEALAGTRIQASLNTAEANRHSSQIVDYSRCPKCRSSDIVEIADEEFSAPPKAEPTTDLASEIKKFKELLDIGAITQEEYDAKKKQLLGL